MTTTPSDDRNPLARALDEAMTGPEARAYAIPIEAVRVGARRRRARRAGGVAVLAVLVVGGVVGGAQAGLPTRWGLPAAPGPTAAAGASPTDGVPAQHARCGRTVDATLPAIGDPATLTLVDPPSSVPEDAAWTASVVADVPAAHDGRVAVVWATDLSVVRDGVVVGVQEGPTAPDLSEPLSVRIGDGGLPTSPFPVTTAVRLTLAPCFPHPTAGDGVQELAPGRYDLVVTQTISYAPPGVVTSFKDVRVSTRTSLEVTSPLRSSTPGADRSTASTPPGAPAP